MFKKAKIQTIFTGVLLLCLVLGWMLYSLFGHQLIEMMYEGRSIGILNEIVKGQATYPLEHYFERADNLARTGLMGSFLILLYLSFCFFKRTNFIFITFLIIPITIYFFGMAPSLVGSDGDEYLLQAYQNGIAHPCGYPIYLWIGKLFMLIMNNNLNSMHIVSCIFSSLILLLLCLFIYRMIGSIRAAVMAVLIYSFTPMFWKFAMQAEVYNVNALFLVSTLYLFYIWNEKHNRKVLMAASFLFGVSLGVWFGNILMLGPILFFIGCKYIKKRIVFIKTVALVLVAIVVGALGPLLYIYFRSKHLPPIGTLYNPDNFKNFILYISGKQYGTMFFPGPVFALERMISHVSLFISSFVGIGLYLAFVGILRKWQTGRLYASFLLLLLCVNFGYVTFFKTWDYFTMPTLSYIIITIFMGSGINEMFAGERNIRRALFFIIPLLLMFQVTTFPSQFQIYKKDTRALNRSKKILNLLPPNAVLFDNWRGFTSLLCVQSILKQRPDVKIYERNNDKRNYKEGNKIETFTWHEYIDDNISDLSRPIFCTKVDSYLENRYKIKEAHNNLFLILPQNEP